MILKQYYLGCLAHASYMVADDTTRVAAVVDPQRWQCCLSSQLLDLARSGRQEEAGAKLLSDLLDGDTPRLCPRIDECIPQGCTSKPLAQSDA